MGRSGFELMEGDRMASGLLSLSFPRESVQVPRVVRSKSREWGGLP